MENFITVLFFLSPVILAAVIYFLKLDQAISIVESLNTWVIKTREKYLGQEGYFKKFVIRPCLWCLSFVMTQSEQIEDKYTRAAVRVGSYLYLICIFLFVAYMAVALFVLFIILGITFWIISFFTESSTSSYRTSSVSNRIKDKKFYNTEGIFAKQTHKVDDKGNIYDTSGVFAEKVGKVTEDGKILDTKGVFAQQAGKIDGDGNIYDTSGVFAEKVGKVTEGGTVKDTSGIFSKEKGKLR